LKDSQAKPVMQSFEYWNSRGMFWYCSTTNIPDAVYQKNQETVKGIFSGKCSQDDKLNTANKQINYFCFLS